MVRAGSIEVVEEVEGQCSETDCNKEAVIIGSQRFREYAACIDHHEELYEWLVDNIEPWKFSIEEEITESFEDENIEDTGKTCPVCGDSATEGSRYCSDHKNLQRHDDHVPRKD